MHAETILIPVSTIFVLGIGAQWIAWRLRLPSILLLLIFGFLAGPVFGILDPDGLLGETLFPLVSISVGVILFEGGLSLNLRELRGGAEVVVRLLVTVGVLVTWIVAGAGAYFILGLPLPISALLGAILTVSGPTVVIPLLRFIRPSARVSNILKWEGILIDPVGATLAVLVFETITAGEFQEYRIFGIFSGIIVTLVAGGTIGALGAGLIVLLFQRGLVPHYLQTAFTLMVLMVAFVSANTVLPEAGLMAVTLMGVVLANQTRVGVDHVVEFKEELGVLLLSVLFIVLAARLQLEDFTALGWPAVIFIALLILVARPVGAYISTIGSELSRRERLFLAWLAPRGIVAASVASVFALELAAGDHPGSEQLVPITFLVVVGTVAVYALTAGPLARRLDLTEKDSQGVIILGAHEWARAIAHSIYEAGFEVALVDSNPQHVRQARMAGLEAIHGNVLTEEVLDRLPLEQIGYFMALTPNLEVNALAAVYFADLLGKDNVYQVAPPPDPNAPLVAPYLRGQSLFDPDFDFRRLSRWFQEGATLRQTRLSKVFNFDSFKAHHGDQALPLFLVHDGHLHVIDADSPPDPRPGDLLVTLVRSTTFDPLAELLAEEEPVGDTGEQLSGEVQPNT